MMLDFFKETYIKSKHNVNLLYFAKFPVFYHKFQQFFDFHQSQGEAPFYCNNLVKALFLQYKFRTYLE